MEGKIQMTKDRMATLDTKGETSDLGEGEEAELHELSENLHSFSRVILAYVGRNRGYVG